MNPPPLPSLEEIETLRTGQRLLCLATFLYIFSLTAIIIQKETVLDALSWAYMAALVMAFIGIYRITKGLDYSVPRRIINGLLPIVPFLGLITLLMVNNKAVKVLKAHGYKVGIMGAPKLK
jgi:uncharacterized membrane protein YjfL (UPF0719 family)